MTVLFRHGFKKGLGPWVPRETDRQIPTGIDCATVENGEAILDIKENPMRTGHIYVPPEEFSVTEGFVEFRMKFEGGFGGHKSGWLQALQPYASKDDHEVDVVEHMGNLKVLHHGIWTQDDEDESPDQVVHGSWRGDATQWHVYGCEMTSTGYIFAIDDVAITATTAYTSIKPKYLIASVLISNWEMAKYGVGNPYDQKARIDWVRVTEV